MRGDWDARAREDARKAIACDAAQDENAFRASGYRDAAIVLEGLEAMVARGSVLEIGCGIGRLLEPLAEHFRWLYGVDVSGVMVLRGKKRLAHLPQIHFTQVDGTGSIPFGESSFDFCFSYITFHHIPQKQIVGRYIAEAFRVLKPGGLFRFQLFGQPGGVLQWVREQLSRKSTWRGCKFTKPEIVHITERSGFEIIETRFLNPWPELHRPFFGKNEPYLLWVTARKP